MPFLQLDPDLILDEIEAKKSELYGKNGYVHPLEREDLKAEIIELQTRLSLAWQLSLH